MFAFYSLCGNVRSPFPGFRCRTYTLRNIGAKSSSPCIRSSPKVRWEFNSQRNLPNVQQDLQAISHFHAEIKTKFTVLFHAVGKNQSKRGWQRGHLGYQGL